MISSIEINDRLKIVDYNPRPKTLLMRIYNSEDFIEDNSLLPLNYNNAFAKIFSYEFDDIYPLDLREFPTAKLFYFNDAKRILQDFKGNFILNDYLVVHCNKGYSRSPAIAAGLNHIFNLGIEDDSFIFHEVHNPNMHVYCTLVRTARRMGFNFKSPWLGE